MSKLVISAGLEECSGVSGEFLAEQKRLFSRNKLFQFGSSLHQWSVTEIFAIKMKKVEGAKDQALRAPPNS